jgi:hypothetical protein
MKSPLFFNTNRAAETKKNQNEKNKALWFYTSEIFQYNKHDNQRNSNERGGDGFGLQSCARVGGDQSQKHKRAQAVISSSRGS